MFLLSCLSSIFLHVAKSTQLNTDSISTCVNKDAETCRATNWASCKEDDEHLELCCWSCQTVVLLPWDVSSCFAGGWHDIMTDTECANAALTNQMIFITLIDEEEMVNQPVGCSKVDRTRDVYQWNPALRADDYDYTDYEGLDGPLRVCLNPRRDVEEDEDFRVYVPGYIGVRSEMDLPEDWDNTGSVRFLEIYFTCADVEEHCQLVADEDSCIEIADEYNIEFDTDSLEYSPGGCYYYDDTVWWNSGDNIEFPPRFTTAYYSHICDKCHKDTCPLPLWTQLVLVALSLTVVFVTIVVICFNVQNKPLADDQRYEPAVVVHQPKDDVGRPEGAPLENREEQYNFNDQSYRQQYPTGRKPRYPLQAADNWDMPAVPMNLGNQQRY